MLKQLLIVTTSIAMITSPAFAKDKHNTKTVVAGQGVTLPASAFGRLTELDADCRVQMKAQRPGALKSIGLSTLRTATPIAGGTALGAKAGNFTNATVSVGSYFKYGLGAGIGSGIAGGIAGHELAKKSGQAGCMAFMVPKSGQTEERSLRNVGVVYNTDAANGHALRGPNGEKLGKADYFLVQFHPRKTNEDADASGDNDAPPPPPPGQ